MLGSLASLGGVLLIVDREVKGLSLLRGFAVSQFDDPPARDLGVLRGFKGFKGFKGFRGLGV